MAKNELASGRGLGLGESETLPVDEFGREWATGDGEASEEETWANQFSPPTLEPTAKPSDEREVAFANSFGGARGWVHVSLRFREYRLVHVMDKEDRDELREL